MKKYQYIFLAIFLGSMLFTVFQYLPLLEEEVHAGKSLVKKTDSPSDETDGGDDDSGDDENDTDDFFSHQHYTNFILFSTYSKYLTLHENYRNLVFNITTPPPKI